MASVPRSDMGISTTYGDFDRRIAIANFRHITKKTKTQSR